MNIKRKLYKAIVDEGAVRAADLEAELEAMDEEGATWRVSLKRAVTFTWGGVERTLPAGAVLGEVYISNEDGGTVEDVPRLFLEQPDTWGYSVGFVEQQMLDAE